MKNRLRFLEGAFASTLCVVLAAGSGFAQDALNASSDRDHARAEGGSIGGGSATKSGADSNGHDASGDRGGSQNRPGVSEVRTGVSAHAGSGVDAGRTGTAPANARGIAPGSLDAGLNPDAEPIRLEEGFTWLQRRANRKTLIANAPKISGRLPAAISISAPFTPRGVTGETGRNAVSVAMPGGPSSDRNAPDFRTYAGIGASGVGTTDTGGVRAGTAKGSAGAMDWRRPIPPPNAVTGAMPHAAVINGTTVSHIASGPGYVGGPARDHSGINGTAIRPKH